VRWLGGSTLAGNAAIGAPDCVPARPISTTSMLSLAEAIASLMLRSRRKRRGRPRPTTTVEMFWPPA
jgi:hypothetical protein